MYVCLCMSVYMYAHTCRYLNTMCLKPYLAYLTKCYVNISYYHYYYY